MADGILTPCNVAWSWHWFRQVTASCNVACEFTKWQHHAWWYVALRWHAIEFAQTSTILKFYIWLRFRPYHHMSFCTSLRNFIQIGPPSAEKNHVMSIFKMADLSHLGFRGPIMGSLKSPCTSSYRSSIETIALNCLVFEKSRFCAFWRQTDRQTYEQMDNIDALSHSRCRERRLNNQCEIFNTGDLCSRVHGWFVVDMSQWFHCSHFLQ